ncbi:MAG TPA: alkaline phosphatase D family protein [Sphingomonadaceae bacterium]|nr:alkaline phosphatase D family protein [Sphingomonadaceae bacterium]
MIVTRRDFIRAIAAGYTIVSAAAFAFPLRAETATEGEAATRFPQGVASADPTPDSVTVWTRLGTATGGDVPLILQISERPDFATAVVSAPVVAREYADHCVMVTVDGLSSDRFYHYRFVTAGGIVSPHGRSRTAPPPEAERAFRFGTVVCQNYQDGFYHAYRELLERDASGEQPLDFVIFLGDFIYEGVRKDGVRPLAFAEEGEGSRPPQGRSAETLEDYRSLYKSYLSDPWLQAARARWPFLSIWDDHEFANDCWQSMVPTAKGNIASQNRRLAASRAWFEFIPTRLSGIIAHPFVQPGPLQDTAFGRDAGVSPEDDADNVAAIDAIGLPRTIRWGSLAEVILTDARSYRSEPLDLAWQSEPYTPRYPFFVPRALVEAEEGDERSMFGTRQFQWLKDQLTRSSARWKILVSSVPMMPFGFGFQYDTATGETESGDIVFTTDAWDGFPAERKALLDFVAAQKVPGVLVLSGDHHTHFAGVLQSNGKAVANEFCVAGASSTALAELLEPLMKSPMAQRLPGRLVNGPEALPDPRWANLAVQYELGEVCRLLQAVEAGQVAEPDPAQRRLNHIHFADLHAYGACTVELDQSGACARYSTYSREQVRSGYQTAQRAIAEVRVSVSWGMPGEVAIVANGRSRFPDGVQAPTVSGSKM